MRWKTDLGSQGFLLVETLIVSLFVMALMALLYSNLYPLVGEYKKYQDYDTTEAIYVAHWARKLALRGLSDSVYSQATTNGYVDISSCSKYTKNNTTTLCNAYESINGISKIYLTPYQTTTFKNVVKNASSSTYQRAWKEYINYLPTYSKNSAKTPLTGYYRVIVEFSRNNHYYYGTIEVKK